MPKRSPFEPVNRQLGANFHTYGGWQLVSDYGDPVAESQGLYECCAAFDVSSFGRISIKGTDSKALVERLTANNLRHLADGRWTWAIVCDDNGHVVDIVRLSSINSTYTVFTYPATREKMLMLLRETAVRYGLEKVQIDDTTEITGMLGIYGPKAFEIVASILPFDLSGVTAGQMVTISVFMMPISILRGSWLGLDGIELICPASAGTLAAGAVARYHKKKNILPAGMDCLEAAFVEASLPYSVIRPCQGVSIGPKCLGFGGLIDAKKDFVGKEAIEHRADISPTRLFVGLKMQSLNTPLYGRRLQELKIQYEGLDIGRTGRIVPSERLGYNVATGLIDNEFYDLTEEVQIVGEGVTMGAEIVELPFDREIAAGIYNL